MYNAKESIHRDRTRAYDNHGFTDYRLLYECYLTNNLTAV